MSYNIKNISIVTLQLIILTTLFLGGAGIITAIDVDTVQARVPTPLPVKKTATTHSLAPAQPTPTQATPTQTASTQAQAAPTQAAPTQPAPSQVALVTTSADDTIRFSHNSQVVNSPFQLKMASLVSGGGIHYTTNGSLPSPSAPIYSGPISVDKNTVIKAQMFNNAGEPVGDIYTKSYIFTGFEQTIPIISIVADWSDLNTLHWNAKQRGVEWEMKSHRVGTGA